MVFHAFAIHPFDGLAAVTLVAARAENYADSGVVEDITEPDDRSGGFVIGHSRKEGIPVFGFAADVVLTGRDIRQRAVDIENSDLIHPTRIDRPASIER